MAYAKCRAAMEKLESNVDGQSRIKHLADLTEQEALKQMGQQPELSEIDDALLCARFLREAFIYEFDSGITKLLALTDNKSHPIHLPFDTVFLDFELPLNESSFGTRCIGILISASDLELSIDDAWAFCEQRDNSLKVWPVLDKEKVFKAHQKTVESHFPDIDFAARRADSDPEIREQIQSIDAITTGAEKSWRTYLAAEKSEFNIVYNFIDLLETPDVDIIPINRVKANARRVRQGLLPLPDGARVVARRDLRRYIYQLEEEKAFQYSYAFWVRGHFRHFRNERYTSSGKRFTKIWVKPYIKGHGVLIKKKYILDKSLKRVVETKYEAQQIDRAAEADKQLSEEKTIDRKLKIVD